MRHSPPSLSRAPAAPALDDLRRQLPALLLRPLRWAPPPAVTLGLRLALGRALAADDLDFLRGRVVRVRINDLDLSWNFGCGDGGLRLLHASAPADTTISGDTRAFLLLASRREDPDSLFFQRRLVVEGDTELGLAVKNLLDSLDMDALPPPLRWAILRMGAAVG